MVHRVTWEVGVDLPGRQCCICHVKRINNKSVKCDCKEEAWEWSFGFLCVNIFRFGDICVVGMEMGWGGGFPEGSTPAVRGS